MGLDIVDVLIARKFRKTLEESNEIQRKQLEVLREIKDSLQRAK